MQGSFVVAVGAGAVGAMIGAAAVSMMQPSAPAPAPLDTKPIADAVERAIARSTAEIRRAAERRRESIDSAGRTESGTPSVVALPSSAERATDDAPAVRRAGDAGGAEGRDSPFATSNPPANYARFPAVTGWDDKTDLRRKWLFADEATCLAWFGTPDQVHEGGDNQENWIYNEPLADADGDGEPDDTRDSVLVFLRGRLVRIDAYE